MGLLKSRGRCGFDIGVTFEVEVGSRTQLTFFSATMLLGSDVVSENRHHLKQLHYRLSTTDQLKN